MNTRAHSLSALAVTGLLAACSSTPESTTYYSKGAAPVGVAAATASPTVSGGLNTATTTERVTVGEPASQATIIGAQSAPAMSGSNPQPASTQESGPSGATLTEEEKRRRAQTAGSSSH